MNADEVREVIEHDYVHNEASAALIYAARAALARLDEARAELARRDTTIAAAREVLAAWDTECPEGIHDSLYGAMDRLRAALSAPVEAGATEPARDGDGDESVCARCAHRVVPGCPDCDPVPYDTSVTCDDCGGRNGVGGACVLPPDHPHVDGIGGVWPATAPAEPDADELLLVRMPGRMSGRATIGHSRLPLTTILGYLRAGDSIDLVIAAYPSLTAEQARVADALRMELDAPDDDEAEDAGTPAAPTSRQWAAWFRASADEADDLTTDQRVGFRVAADHLENPEIAAQVARIWFDDGEAGTPADEPAPDRAASPDDLRAAGWAVAVHNDYRLQGQPHTFWLFTSGDRAVKGEGRTDAEALAQVRRALAEAGTPAEPLHEVQCGATIRARMADAPTEPADDTTREAWGPLPDIDSPALDDETGVVIGRFLDATEQHGDRVMELWDDDVHRTRGGASNHYVEHVDDERGGWEVYELHRLPNPRAALAGPADDTTREAQP